MTHTTNSLLWISWFHVACLPFTATKRCHVHPCGCGASLLHTRIHWCSTFVAVTGPKIAHRCAGAREFEVFVATFRCLKTLIYQGKTLTLGDFHFGATFSTDSCAKMQMEVKRLNVGESQRRHQTTLGVEAPVTVSPLYDAKNAVTTSIKGSDFFIVNAPGAQAADVFGPLVLAGGHTVLETYACRARVNTNVTADAFGMEMGKAGGEFFIFFCNHNANRDIFRGTTRCCAVVDKRAWQRYFGTFAGRAWYMAANLGLHCTT
eukprot:TRINITY_DN4010_c0_g1_i1.p2 TRINITY_DN4010_c0_g1~~TRINITY_DN4010_c0_g1_i1.p2  ORF type:complete len:262 (-),score=30.15 TRINITY_DN4010_c0_g1_i1:69-854(-)